MPRGIEMSVYGSAPSAHQYFSISVRVFLVDQTEHHALTCAHTVKLSQTSMRTREVQQKHKI